MNTLSIWKNQANKIQVVQLSDDILDGTDKEQIEYLKTLDFYADLTCVSEKYTGTFPDTDSSLWEWVGGKIVTAVPTPEQRKAEKQSEIDALEASQYMTRGEREGWLAMIEAQATAQGVPLDLLYTANPFYKKLKDVNTAVTALRAELKAIV